ncbi:MAG: hypothetical protein H5T68_02835 [Chloroflexi bacterium]|nr:hypothetical protein [Chloroflexota bacterium]
MDEEERAIQAMLIKYLVAHTQCSGCGRRYKPSDVQIHERHGDVWLASVTCSACGLRGLIMAAIRSQEAEELEPLFEEEVEEGVALREMEPISADDVLDFHRFIQEFDGDMEELFRRLNE